MDILQLPERIETERLVIRCWIRTDATGRGLATETARALTRMALAAPGIERVQIRCDPKNARSRRVAEKLGYRLVETLIGNEVTPDGKPRDTVVYEIRESGE